MNLFNLYDYIVIGLIITAVICAVVWICLIKFKRKHGRNGCANCPHSINCGKNINDTK